jgi:acetylornithine deacetylase
LASTWPTEVEFLRELVAIPSVSGAEEALARHLEAVVAGWGLAVVRDDTGVKVTVEGAGDGPTLAFISHLDVVPPGEGWTRDPFLPVIEDGRLYGRGSGDAKASVATMLLAARDLAERRPEFRGRLVVILGFGEETKDTTMGRAVATVGPIDAAVVGEPTNLDVAVAQRGLMMADLVATGDQRHAGYAAQDGDFTNAITALAADLARLDGIVAERVHPVLGVTTVTPTMLSAGVSRNVTPPVARAVLDIRSTPDWTHEELEQVLAERLSGELQVTSRRLVPCETPAGSAVLAAALRARPTARTFGSPTCSDWVFVRHLDAIKCGPGTSRRSHTPDEAVDLDEVTAARAFYATLALEYLG